MYWTLLKSQTKPSRAMRVTNTCDNLYNIDHKAKTFSDPFGPVTKQCETIQYEYNRVIGAKPTVKFTILNCDTYENVNQYRFLFYFF
jgi:hypothetical protein